MKQRYFIREIALTDLEEIWLYTLSEWDLEQADGYTAMLPGFGHTWQYSDADYEAASSLGKKPGTIKPSEVSSYYYNKAVKYIISSPGHFLRLLIKKLYLFWNRFDPTKYLLLGEMRDRGDMPRPPKGEPVPEQPEHGHPQEVEKAG